MRNSIENIWKEGFLNETSLVAPKINDLYNQKSKHLIGKVEKMFRVNLIVIVIMSIIILLIYYFLDVFLFGLAASVLLLLTAWYNYRLMHGLKTLNQGANSLDYLKSLDRWIKDALLKSGKVVRFSYPLFILIAVSTVWSAWNKQGISLEIFQKLPDLTVIGDISLYAIILAGVPVLLMAFFSIKIYKWEVRLMYGRVLDKLKETIAEMEKLKQEP